MKNVWMISAVVAALSLSRAASANQLNGGDYLFPGQNLTDSSCGFYTTMQSDGNLVMYGAGYAVYPGDTATHGAVWASNTQNTGGYAVMQSDGNFVIYNWSDQAVWATGTLQNSWNSVFQISNATLFVENRLSNDWVWQSGALVFDQEASPCPVTQVVTTLWSSYDCPGNDFESIAVGQHGASWCGYYCAQDSRCNSFTYVPPGVQGPNAVCWLKTPDSCGGWSYGQGMVTGIKRFN